MNRIEAPEDPGIMQILPLLGAAIISGGAGLLGASKTSSAAKKTAEQNNALQREIYNQNKQILTPFIDQGRVASERQGELLGLGDDPAQWQAYIDANPDLVQAYNANKQVYEAQGESLLDFARRHYTERGRVEGRDLPSLGMDPGLERFGDATGLTAGNNAIDEFLGLNGGGFDDYLESTGFKFAQDQGMESLLSRKATSGLLGSGAAVKDALRFNQGLAQQYGRNYLADVMSRNNQRQNQFGAYWGATGDIANRGLSAGNALAGVGTNFASGVSQSNNNALQATAGANASMANTVNSTIGNALGAYAYGQGLNPTQSSWASTPGYAGGQMQNPLGGTLNNRVPIGGGWF
jgi:hypothetical protein